MIIPVVYIYANFTVDKALYARTVLDQALLEGERYGAQDIGHGRTVCIDYSSINIAKQFHIGHLSSTAIGHALYNLYNFMGYKSIGINHLGDWGTQFGKLLAAYELWGDEAAVREKGVEAVSYTHLSSFACVTMLWGNGKRRPPTMKKPPPISRTMHPWPTTARILRKNGRKTPWRSAARKNRYEPKQNRPH